ncbi:MAG: histidine phosphatase family protein [Thiotrichales bacterium]|nr:histidine phosphatase family protein [Thiotrichales bacterium]
MKRCYLAFLRHAHYHQQPQTPSALQPYSLTPEGIEQSQTAGKTLRKLLKHQEWELHPLLFCSPLLRSWQTARELQPYLKGHCQISTHSALNERSVGSLANLSHQQIEAVLEQDPRCAPLPPHWKHNADFCLPVEGAESLMQAGARLSQFLSQTLTQVITSAQNNHQLVVMVGHAAAFRYAAYQLGLLEKAEIGRYSMHYAQPMVFECRLKNHQLELELLAGKWKARPESEKPD